MSKNTSHQLGTHSIKFLLIKQSVPAAVGMLLLSFNMIADTVFVGQWIGPIAIAAITIVLPLVFLLSSIGMAVGIAGSSMISRALGKGEQEKANHIFGNMLSLTLVPTIGLCLLCGFFEREILYLFGANDAIYQVARPYYQTLLWGIPVLATIMVGNNIARAEAKPKIAMNVMIVSTLSNVVFNFIVLNYFDYGLLGVGVVTVVSYILCFIYLLFSFFKKTELKLKFSNLCFNRTIVIEMISLGSVSFFRQGSSNLLSILLNHTLLFYGSIDHVTVYGIVSRVVMLVFFPVLGVTQGMMPIVGYNYGAEQYDRVLRVINTSIRYTMVISVTIFIVLMVFPKAITFVFTKDLDILSQTPFVMRMIFLATPLVAYHFVGSSYFQAIGSSKMALMLTLSRQLFFLIPLILIFPLFWGLLGVWLAFPVSDVLSSALAFIFLKRSLNKLPDGLPKL